MRLRRLLTIVLISILSLTLFSSGVFAAEKVFSAEELATFDGKDGHPAYFAYKGKVYDVTTSKLWKLGEHYGLSAGQDLTEKMAGAPHGEEVLAKLPVVGSFVSTRSVQSEQKNTSSEKSENVEQKKSSTTVLQPKYAGRIKLFGMSILGWTGILLGIFFTLNFATCFALPWSGFPLPWKGEKPGPDALDNASTHMPWSHLHKYFAWLTVVFGVTHGILGFMQMMGLYL